MCTACPCHFNILFSIVSKIVCVTSIFSLIIHCLLLIVRRSLQLFSRNPFLYLTVFSLTYNPVSKFPNRNLKCFQSLYKILISEFHTNEF
jgi:hypothetical protein